MNNIKISIINLESRADRRSAVLADLRNIGQIKVSEDNLFKAILNEGNGALGCAISHFTILSQFISEIQYEYLVVFEDDFMPRKSIDPGDILLKLKGLVSLDIFLFSHNMAVTTQKIGEDFHRVIDSQTTAGYLITRKFAPKLLTVFAQSINLLSLYKNTQKNALINKFFAIDSLWKPLQIENNFITTIPALGEQRASFSDIEKKHVDYGV